MSFSYFTAGKLSLFNTLSFFLEFPLAFLATVFLFHFPRRRFFYVKDFWRFILEVLMSFLPTHYTITHDTELNSWLGGRVSFLKFQNHLPSCTFLCVTNPLTPQPCPELVSAQVLAPSTRVCLLLILVLQSCPPIILHP